MYRKDGQIDFGLGAGAGLSDTAEGWAARFADDPLVVLGPAGAPTDPSARYKALFGLAAPQVQRVELHYTDGTVDAASVGTGGFVVIADARRSPGEIVAYDAAGRKVATRDVRGVDLRTCTDERGCPPGSFVP